MQTLEEFLPRQGPVLLDPCRDPPPCGLKLLTRRAARAAQHAVPLWPPGACASQEGEAPPPARVQTAAPQEMGLLWRDLEVELLQPLGEYPVQPLCIVPIAEGAPPVIGIAPQQRFAASARFDDLGTPQGQGIVPIPVGQDGGHRPAWGRTGIRVANLSVRLQNTSLQPFPDQVQQGPVLKAHAEHVHEPRLVPRVDAAWHVRLNQGALRPVVQVKSAGAHRIQCPTSGSIAVTTIQNVWRIDCWQELRTGQWHTFSFERRHTSWPFRAIFLWNVPASDQLGPGALRLQALRQGCDIGMPSCCIGLRCHVVPTTGRLRVPVAPTV